MTAWHRWVSFAGLGNPRQTTYSPLLIRRDFVLFFASLPLLVAVFQQTLVDILQNLLIDLFNRDDVAVT